MSAFTPGPWTREVGDHSHRFVAVKDNDDRTIYYKYGAGPGVDADRDEANAVLIAAAPCMYEALERAERLPGIISEIAELADYGADDDDEARLEELRREYRRTLEIIRVALSKATGT